MIVYVTYKKEKLTTRCGYDSWEDSYTIFGGVFDNELDAAKFCMKHPNYKYMEYNTTTQERLEIEV